MKRQRDAVDDACYRELFTGLGNKMIGLSPFWRDVYRAMFRAEPKNLRRHVARRIIKAFESSGESHHEPDGSTLWVVVEHCRLKGLDYRIEVRPDEYFHVVLVEE